METAGEITGRRGARYRRVQVPKQYDRLMVTGITRHRTAKRRPLTGRECIAPGRGGRSLELALGAPGKFRAARRAYPTGPTAPSDG
jgi:hypothetical protein